MTNKAMFITDYKTSSLRGMFSSLKPGNDDDTISSIHSTSSQNSVQVSFGRVNVKHVHETDDVAWMLSCSVDDYELNKFHHEKEKRKAAIVVNRGTPTMEKVPDMSAVEAYKYMSQSNSLLYEEKLRKRMEQRKLIKKEPLFWF